MCTTLDFLSLAPRASAELVKTRAWATVRSSLFFLYNLFGSDLIVYLGAELTRGGVPHEIKEDEIGLSAASRNRAHG